MIKCLGLEQDAALRAIPLLCVCGYIANPTLIGERTKVVFGWQHLDLNLDLKSIDLKCLDLKSIDFKIPCLGLFK